MTYLEDFVSSVQTLPTELQKNYQLLRELDQKFQVLQKHMQVQLSKGLDEVEKVKKSGTGAPDAVAQDHSDNVLSVHKACLTIAEEKVFLAVQTYDLVDGHIQRLDKDLKKMEEELRKDREAAGGGLVSAGPRLDGASGGLGRDGGDGTRAGGRKKGSHSIATNVNVELDLPVDPNEPTYCYCGQVSYGEMIACDNPECKIEWFHFDCVGIKERPKGKWYCSDCAVVMKRRRPKATSGGKPSTKKMQSALQASYGSHSIPTNVDVALDLPVDTNETTYCRCEQVPHGEMIACDNPECNIEWFHFDCVGIKERPKGKWYCSDCAVVMERRRPQATSGGKPRLTKQMLR